MAAPTAPVLDAAARRRRLARRGRVRPRAQDAPGARGRAGRDGRAPAGHARREDARPGLRRPREAVAPEGHRPRPRRHDPRAAVDRRRRRVRAEPALVRPEGQQEGDEGRASDGAVGRTRRPGRSASSTRRSSTSRRRRPLPRCSRPGRKDTPLVVVATEDEDVADPELPQSRARRRRVSAQLEVTDIVWARSLVVSKPRCRSIARGRSSWKRRRRSRRRPAESRTPAASGGRATS